MSDDIGRIVAGILGLHASEVTDDLAMDESDTWDSLKHMELVAAVEEHLGSELIFEEIVSMRTVRAIREVVERHSGG